MPHQCTSCGFLFDDGSKAMLSGCPDCGGNTFQFHPKGAPIPEIPDDDPPEPEGGTVGDTVGRATNAVRGIVNRGDQPAGAPEDHDELDGSIERSVEESPEYGRDADVEHAPWPSEDPEDGGSGPAPHAEPTDGAGRTARDEGMDDSGIDQGLDDDGIIDADAREGNTAEDEAQASARTEFVGPDELPGREGGDDATEGGEDARTGPPGGPPSNGRVVREPTGEQPSLDELRQELNDQFESIKIVNPGEYELNLMELYNREEYVVALQENGRYVIQMPENWMRDRDED